MKQKIKNKLKMRYVLAFFLAWYIVARIFSPMGAVKVKHSINMVADPINFSKLKIGSYNIAHGRGLASSNFGEISTRLSRLKQIALTLKEKNLDIVVLNEVDFDAGWSGHINQAEFIAKIAGYPYWVEQNNFNVSFLLFRLRFGNCVLSKYPILEAKLIDFPTYVPWEGVAAGKKEGLLCKIKLSEKISMAILALHLDDRCEQIRISAAKIVQQIQNKLSLPLIVAGDFNSSPVEYPHAVFNRDQKNTALSLLLKDNFKTFTKDKPQREDFTYPSNNPVMSIDWILVCKQWQIISKEILPITLSDHKPIIATLHLKEF